LFKSLRVYQSIYLYLYLFTVERVTDVSDPNDGGGKASEGKKNFAIADLQMANRLKRFQPGAEVVRLGERKEQEGIDVIEDQAPYEVNEEYAREVLKTAGSYFGATVPLSNEKVLALFERAKLQEQNTPGVKEAVGWAANYEIDSKVVEENEARFRAHGLDFEQMATRQQGNYGMDRFSEEKIKSLSSDNPEIPKLVELAKGMPTELPPEFECNGRLPSKGFSGSYEKVAPAFHKLLMAIHDKGLAIILTAVMAFHIFGLHFGVARWVPKTGKVEGRPIVDLTHCTGDPLNSDYAKEKADDHWGVIVHPTIMDLATMIVEAVEDEKGTNPEIEMKDFILLKMDLEGAYTLLNIHPAHASKFAVQLIGGLVFIFLCGVFGWGSTPACFQVITRALDFEIKKFFRGRSKWYVDDLMAVCLPKHLEYNKRVTTKICTNLLGTLAVAKRKTEVAQRLVFIGYSVDVVTGMVSLSEKNLLRMIYGFFTVDLKVKVPIRVVEKLASWSSRYGAICPAMKPFSRALYSLIGGVTNRCALVDFTIEAQRAVRMWRAMLVLLAEDELVFGKTIVSFVTDNNPRFIVEFDASLSGAGLLWYQRQKEDGSEVSMGGGAVDLRGLDFGSDASYQNTAEFIAMIMGVLGLLQMGIRDVAIEVRGDSETALSWAVKGRPKGDLATNAAMVFALLCIIGGFRVTMESWISGEDNWRCDRLSRLGEKGQLDNLSVRRALDDMDRVATPVIELGEPVLNLLALCNPNTEMVEDAAFNMFWSSIKDNVQSILSGI
jgi:hypothetical protein